MYTKSHMWCIQDVIEQRCSGAENPCDYFWLFDFKTGYLPDVPRFRNLFLASPGAADKIHKTLLLLFLDSLFYKTLFSSDGFFDYFCLSIGLWAQFSPETLLYLLWEKTCYHWYIVIIFSFTKFCNIVWCIQIYV